MGTKLAQRTEFLTDSMPLAISARAKELMKEGRNVINLSVGEPDFPSPSAVKEAGIQAINDNFTRYTAAAGIPELRAAVAESIEKEQGLKYEPTQVVMANGAKQAIASLFLAILDPGDEVIIPVPCYASYFEQVHLAGGVPVSLMCLPKNNFRPDIEELKQKINWKTKAIIFNSPNNPTGAAWSEEEIREIGALFKDTKIWVISDDIYEKLRYDGKKHLSFAAVDGLKDQSILLNGVSKYFAMTGWRMGYAAAPPELAKALAKIQSQMSGSPGSVNQKAALAAYTQTMPEPEEMVQAFARRKSLITEELIKIPDLRFLEPEGAFYVFPDVTKYFGKKADGEEIKDSYGLCMYLLEKKNLALVPGSAFKREGHIRISFAASDQELRDGVARLAEGLRELQD